MHRPKPPWSLWGCLGTAEAGGFRRQSLRNFLPIPSSLFPKKPSPFHMSLYFGKVPTVNPSVTAAPCQLPFAREPLRVVPADNFARWLSTNRSFPDPPGIGGLPPNLFTIPSSLFSKSARYRYCGGSGCTDQSPPCQRGVPRHRRGGGIPQAKPAELLTYSLFTIP